MTKEERSEINQLADRVREDPQAVSVERIVAALDHRDASVREQATTALFSVSKHAPGRLLDALPRLALVLESDRPTLRHKAVAAMSNVGVNRPESLVPYVDDLVDLLDDEAGTVRQSAVRALRSVVTEEPSAVTPAIDRLIPLLGSDLESTRLDAVTVLERLVADDSSIGSKIIEPLLAVLGDRYEPPSGITFDPNVTPPRASPEAQMRGYRMLITDHEDRSSNVRARETAAATIATITEADPAATTDWLEPYLPRLFDLLDDRNPTIRGAVVSIIGAVAEVNPTAVRPIEEDLVSQLDEPIAISEDVVWALRAIGSQRARATLEDLAADGSVDPNLRATAENALEDIES